MLGVRSTCRCQQCWAADTHTHTHGRSARACGTKYAHHAAAAASNSGAGGAKVRSSTAAAVAPALGCGVKCAITEAAGRATARAAVHRRQGQLHRAQRQWGALARRAVLRRLQRRRLCATAPAARARQRQGRRFATAQAVARVCGAHCGSSSLGKDGRRESTQLFACQHLRTVLLAVLAALGGGD
jgi:hypothetical protein